MLTLDHSDAFTRLFRSDTPIAKLKDAAFNGRLFTISSVSEELSLGIAGRSLAWKVITCRTCLDNVTKLEGDALPIHSSFLSQAHR